MKNISSNFHRIIVFAIVGILTISTIIAMSTFIANNNNGDEITIENAFNSALVQCYALEGQYPADYHHLKDYGVWINDDKYMYDYGYIVFAPNIKPTIVVRNKKSNSTLKTGVSSSDTDYLK